MPRRAGGPTSIATVVESATASPRVPTSSIESHVARFRCDSAPTTPHTFTPDLTTPTDAGSGGTGHGQYFRSRVAAVKPVGVCVEATVPTPREAATSRKAGYRDHTFHQERDLLPSHRHRRRRDGAHLLRSRLPHTSYVGLGRTTTRSEPRGPAERALPRELPFVDPRPDRARCRAEAPAARQPPEGASPFRPRRRGRGRRWPR
jgi:hypothetical protein